MLQELSVRILNFDTEKEQLQNSISTVSTESQKEIQEKIAQCRNLENQLAVRGPGVGGHDWGPLSIG